MLGEKEKQAQQIRANKFSLNSCLKQIEPIIKFKERRAEKKKITRRNKVSNKFEYAPKCALNNVPLVGNFIFFFKCCGCSPWIVYSLCVCVCVCICVIYGVHLTFFL